jgi:hypothetical protein
MADANAVIRDLGQQVAQLTVDKAILTAELAEANERSADLTAAMSADAQVAE